MAHVEGSTTLNTINMRNWHSHIL